MLSTKSLSPARGDQPYAVRPVPDSTKSLPRTRGSTVDDRHVGHAAGVSPPHAGINRGPA